MKRSDYRPPAYLVDHVSLNFAIFDHETLVTSRLQLRRNPAQGAPHELVLDGDGLDTVSVVLDGRTLGTQDYQMTPNSLTLRPGEKAELVVTTRVLPRENKALSGLYHSGSQYCTQCEAEGFRRITWFPDRPDVMAPYTVRIEADEATCPVLLSNGNLHQKGNLGGGRHFVEWIDPFRKPSYLCALVAGNLERYASTYTTLSGRTIDLIFYTEHGQASQCVWSMESLKRAMRWDEVTYGREYDLDLFHIVAVSDFNMGAMENKSLNIFNTSAVYATQNKTTDAGFVRVEAIVAHEYFHNWTGNRITCRDWFQLTLKEGLTVFRDQSFTADHHSADAVRIDEVAILRSAQFAEDQSPMAHPIRPEEYEAIDNFYTVTVYEKGAEVIRMLKTLLGAERYRRATDLYFERFDGQAVTCEDFVRCMEDASGLDLSQFRLWYSQAGTPTLKVSTAFDRENRRYTLRFQQHFATQPQNLPAVLPVRVGLLAPDGTCSEHLLVVSKADQNFAFEGVSHRPVPSLLRGFSAPVHLETDLTDDDHAFLLAHDSDGFVRAEAGFTVKKSLLLARIADHQAGRPLTSAVGLEGLLRTVLSDPVLAPELKVRLLTLPPQSVLEQACSPVDPLAIHATIKTLRCELARGLRSELLATYLAHHQPVPVGDFPTDAEMASRALKNVCLSYLGTLDDGGVFQLAETQFRQARTMTDRLGALAVFRDTVRPQRDEFLGAFAREFSDDKLVMDTWFSLQAMTDRIDVIDVIRALERHPAFENTNPNRARSLYRQFRASNPAGFHHVSGEGYHFVSAAVAAIDAFNPMIASNLASSFQNWTRFAEPFRSLQRRALETLATKPGLSVNTAELVGKYLAANSP